MNVTVKITSYDDKIIDDNSFESFERLVQLFHI